MLPDLDSLALFVRAAELRSLTKAAEASHIGLAAASRRMALLEHRFRTSLFERSPRGVELTPAGESLLPHARAVLIEINAMQSDMRDHASGSKGVLRILANTSAMTGSLPADLAIFSQAHPDVHLIVIERWSDEIVRAMNAAEGDVGIVVEGLCTDGLDAYPYRTDRLSVVLRADHRLAKEPSTLPIPFEELLDDGLVALESASSMMRLLIQQAVIAEKTLQLRAQVRSFEAVCRLVQSGLGAGLLPSSAALSLGPSMGLVVRPLADDWAERRMLICVKQQRPRTTSMTMLIKHLIHAHRRQP
jgi:DNA-binding transcriptional LysR family regulator